MAIRFRKSLKLAPGIRMNLSGGGLSWSLGPRGASVGIGKRGTYLNAGIPGTGLYSRQRLSGGSRSSGVQSRPSSAGTSTFTLTVSVSDDGDVTFKDSNGNLVSEELINIAKKQQGDAIKGLIQGKCDEINGQVAALGELHINTPPPGVPPKYLAASFDMEHPRAPTLKTPGLMAGLFKSKKAQIDADNARAVDNFRSELKRWQDEKSKFEAGEQKKHDLVQRAVAGSPDAMEDFFGEVLLDITWPRETLTSFEVQDGGKQLAFDVDLPEIEDMPVKTASVPQRGYKLTVKELGPTAVQKMYAQHIHSICFRLIGEAFGMLPTEPVRNFVCKA